MSFLMALMSCFISLDSTYSSAAYVEGTQWCMLLVLAAQEDEAELLETEVQSQHGQHNMSPSLKIKINNNF
jgi:hypothetical protein